MNLSRQICGLVAGTVVSLVAARTAVAEEAAAKTTVAKGIRFVAPNGKERWFAGYELRRIVGNEPYADFRASELSLNAWIRERNTESVGLEIAEVGAFTLAGFGLLLGGALIYGGITSEDALGRGIGWGFGLPIAGAGIAFGGIGACLVWIDGQDLGAIRQPEFALGGIQPRTPPRRLALVVRW